MARVLYVEDDSFLRNIVKRAYEEAGLEVSTAANVKEAFSILEKEKVDIILLDLLLPGEHGFDFLEQKKEMGEIQDIPVVVFSNLDAEDDRKKAMDLGAAEYHLKVLTQPKTVLKNVFSILEQRGVK